MTDLLSPSCFSGMFSFTFLDSFLLKAFSAFPYSSPQTYHQYFQEMYMRDQFPPYLVSLWFPSLPLLNVLQQRQGIYLGTFSANLSVLSSSLGFSTTLGSTITLLPPKSFHFMEWDF